MAGIKEIDFSVSLQNIPSDVLYILNQIRPMWLSNKISIQPLIPTGYGYYNDIIKCWHQDDQNETDVILIRVFSDLVKEQVDHRVEFTLLKRLHRAGACLPVYARFNNGYAYAYTPGRVIKLDEMFKPQIIRKIIERFHAIHGVPCSDLQHLQSSAVFCVYSQRALDILTSSSSQHLDSHTEFVSAHHSRCNFIAEVKHGRALYEELVKSFPVTICHMDVKQYNVIYDENSENVTFIDWDFVGVGPEILDLASYFIKCNSGNVLDAGIDVVNDAVFKLTVVREYLASHPGACGEEVGSGGDADPRTRLWVDGFNKSIYLCMLFGAMWCITQPPHDTLDLVSMMSKSLRWAKEIRTTILQQNTCGDFVSTSSDTKQ